MHVTLAQYNSLTPAEQRLVTSIDASITDDCRDSAYPQAMPSTPDTWDDETCGSIPNPEWGL